MITKNPYCNFEPDQANIKRLSCEAWRLTEIKVLKNEEWIGGHFKLAIFKCSKCENYWKIGEEFDSHHGYYKEAIKLNDSMQLNGEEISFSIGELQK